MRIEFSLIRFPSVPPSSPPHRLSQPCVCLVVGCLRLRKGTFVVSVLLCQDDVPGRRRQKKKIDPSSRFKQSHAEEFICLGLALSRR